MRPDFCATIDDRLRAVDDELCDESKDPLPVIWTGTVAFPKVDHSGYVHMLDCRGGGL